MLARNQGDGINFCQDISWTLDDVMGHSTEVEIPE